MSALKQPWHHADAYSPLLTTKLTPPRARPTVMPRHRLTDQLDSGLSHALTLVVAPAGFGKTTLLSAWARQVRHPIVWVSLDHNDNDLVRFWRYLIVALQTLRPNLGATTLPIETLLTVLVNDLASASEHLILILDDYHEITCAAIHQSLAFLMNHLPSHLHLVLASRAAPPLPLAQLRMRGELVELHIDDLRFTPDETEFFLRTSMALPLTSAEATQLHARTEGWIGALHLAALELRPHPDPTSFVRRFSGRQRVLMAYLADELLARQPAPIQAFLLHTAVLERLNVALCVAVTGQDDRTAVSAWLDQANLFLTPVDAERQWYRYHSLVAEMLRERLHQIAPQQELEAHRRAAAWYIANGLLVDAVPHALAGGDIALAAEVIAALADGMWLQGEVSTLAHWLGALPDALIRTHPPLALARARIWLLQGPLAALTPEVRAIAQPLDKPVCQRDDPTSRRSPTVVAPADTTTASPTLELSLSKDLEHTPAAIAAIVAMLQDADPQTLAQARTALARSPALVTTPLAALTDGFAFELHGELARARQAFTQALTLSQRRSEPHAERVARSYLANLALQQGQLQVAAAQYIRALRCAAEVTGQYAASAHHALIGLGQVWYEWNDLATARCYLDDGIARAQASGRIDRVLVGTIARAAAEQAQGDAAAATRTLEAAAQLAQRTQASRLIAVVASCQARLALRQGDAAAADHWARVCGLGIDDELEAFRESEHLTFARVLLARGTLDAALHLLERIAVAAHAAGRIGRVISTLLVTACVYQAGGALDRAYDMFGQALELAEPGGYIRSVVDEGATVGPLLEGLACAGVVGQPVNVQQPSLAYLSALQAAWRSEYCPAPNDVQASVSEPAALARVLLSRREHEILQGLATGLTNEALAHQFGVSVNTVTTHLKHIYSKLGVHGRLAAVAQARRLHLIP